MPHRRNGFTLIELLVVISIIALLIAILLPALSAARNTAQNARCLSNQRQIILGMHMYAEDYKERFPLIHDDNLGDKGYTVWWRMLGGSGILPTGEEKFLTDATQNAFICPSDIIDAEGSGITVNHHSDRYSSYSLSLLVAAHLGRTNGGIEQHVHNVDSKYRAHWESGGPRLSDIHRASDVIAGGEAVQSMYLDYRYSNVGNGQGGTRNNHNFEWVRHGMGVQAQWPHLTQSTSGGQTNAFYVDGHASVIRHNGTDVVGTLEVPANELAQSARMWLY